MNKNEAIKIKLVDAPKNVNISGIDDADDTDR